MCAHKTLCIQSNRSGCLLLLKFSMQNSSIKIFISGNSSSMHSKVIHDDVIKWKNFPRCWPFVRGIHRPPVNSPHKDQWRGALMFSLICAWMNGWVNNREAGDLRRHRAHYDVIVMIGYGKKRTKYRIYSSISELIYRYHDAFEIEINGATCYTLNVLVHRDEIWLERRNW